MKELEYENIEEKIDIKFNVSMESINQIIANQRAKDIAWDKEHWAMVGVSTDDNGHPIFNKE